MTDTDAGPLETIVTTLARGCCVLFVLLVVACLAGARPAWGEEPAKLDNPASADIEEMAGALGFADSHAPGFWEALTQAVADQHTQAKERETAAAEQAAAERADQLKQAILDASTYGRRIEKTEGRVTTFTELIPPADGDIIDGTILIRVGSEEVAGDGTKTIIAKYLKPHSTDAIGVVVTKVEDGVETVTKVIEYEPGAIDVKVGDSRPVPPPGSSSVGKKPHTFDPKADGSYGRASGGQPNGGAKLEAPDPTPIPETVVHDKAGNGDLLWFDSFEGPDGRTYTPYLEAKPFEDLPYRSGYRIQHPDWDGAEGEIEVLYDKDGKVAGIVAKVIKDGIATIVSVKELIPGSLNGLKKGDTLPARDKPGDVASSWGTKPKSSSSGPTSGPVPTAPGSSFSSTSSSLSPSGSSQNDGQQKDSGTSEADRAKPEPAPDGGNNGDEGSGNGGGTTSGTSEAPAQTEQQSSFNWGASHTETSDDGTKTTTYWVENPDGTHDIGTKTERPDGTTSCTVQKKTGEQDAACPSGRTDEPTCRVDCARFAVLAELFFCSAGPSGGADCGQPPEGTTANPHKQECATSGEDRSATPDPHAPRGGQSEGSARPDCTNADAPGGPSNYGDPNDPNGQEPPDASQIPWLINDGVTDPVNPGEGEVTSADSGSIRLDMHGALRDPANPPGTEDPDHNPGGGPPSTGEAEHNPR